MPVRYFQIRMGMGLLEPLFLGLIYWRAILRGKRRPRTQKDCGSGRDEPRGRRSCLRFCRIDFRRLGQKLKRSNSRVIIMHLTFSFFIDDKTPSNTN